MLNLFLTSFLFSNFQLCTLRTTKQIPSRKQTTTTTTNQPQYIQNQSTQDFINNQNNNQVNYKENQYTTEYPTTNQQYWTQQTQFNELNYQNNPSVNTMPEYAYSVSSSSPSISLDGSSQHYQQNFNQYSTYNDFLQPEEIFQLDQPIRSSYSDSIQSKSPSTLLDLESGTIHKNNLDNTNIWHNSENYKYESSCDDTNSLTSGSSMFDDFYQSGGVSNQLQQNMFQSQDYLNYDLNNGQSENCSQYYSIKSEPQNVLICDQNNFEQYNDWDFPESYATNNLGLVQF